MDYGEELESLRLKLQRKEEVMKDMLPFTSPRDKVVFKQINQSARALESRITWIRDKKGQQLNKSMMFTSRNTKRKLRKKND